MDRKITGIGIGAVFVLVMALMFGVVVANTNGSDGSTDEGVNCPMHRELTEEQREAISDKIVELRGEEISHEEMRAEMQDLFEELGIEHEGMNCGGHGSNNGMDREEFKQRKSGCPMH